MSLNGILEVKPFYCRGRDFMGLFPPFKSHVYILVCMDYATKWVKSIACVANDAQSISNFLKNNVFPRFGVPKVLISEGGTLLQQVFRS